MGGKSYLHQTHSYFEDVVAKRKVSEAIPGTLDPFLSILARVQESFAAVV